MHLWGDGMSLGLVYKNGEHIFDEVCGEVPFLTYPLFEKTGVVKSAFSTRIVQSRGDKDRNSRDAGHKDDQIGRAHV